MTKLKIILFVLFVLSSVFLWRENISLVEAASVIYIRPDGSI